MREAIDAFWKLAVFAKLAVAARLLLQGLAGEYPALLTACCILPIRSLLLMFSFSGSLSRVRGTQLQTQGKQLAQNLAPIVWVLSAWIVFELFSKWTKSYLGIGRFGKLLLASLLVIALLLSVAGWRVEWERLVFEGNFRIYYILDRIVLVALALFVMGTWLFFRNYPVPIAPNVIRHTYIAGAYFIGSAASAMAFTLNGMKVIVWVNLAVVLVSAGASCAWAVLLTRKGQVTPPVQQVSVEDRDRIARINEELLVFMGNFPKNNRPS